jgi:thiamine biosynthesis lipoprotein
MGASRPRSRSGASARRTTVVLSLLVAAVALAALLRGRDDRVVSRELYVFGSLSTIEVVAPRARADAALDAIERRLARRHREWHPWEPSGLTALGDAIARGEAHRPPRSIVALVEASRPLVAASGGRFDPGAGGLVALWGFHTSDYPVRTPAPGEIAIARWRAARPSLADVVVVGHGAVYSPNPHVRLDFNAVAEGMATREIATLLRAHGIGDALVALGGDVHALGSRGTRAWRVALRDPDGGALGVVELADGESLYASGGYQRFRDGPGGRATHVLDPRTGRPAEGARATAVLARDPVLADAAATALLVAGPAEWRDVAVRMGVACALLVDDAGTVHATRALDARVAWSTQRPLEASGAPGECTPSMPRRLRHNGDPQPDDAPR